MRNACIFPYPCSPGPVPVTVIVECERFFVLITSAGKVASLKQRDSEQEQGFHPHARVGMPFGKSESFIGKD